MIGQNAKPLISTALGDCPWQEILEDKHKAPEQASLQGTTRVMVSCILEQKGRTNAYDGGTFNLEEKLKVSVRKSIQAM